MPIVLSALPVEETNTLPPNRKTGDRPDVD
jgi:hypothetical protein